MLARKLISRMLGSALLSAVLLCALFDAARAQGEAQLKPPIAQPAQTIPSGAATQTATPSEPQPRTRKAQSKNQKSAQPQDSDTIDDPTEKAIPATATLNALAETSGVEGEVKRLPGCPLTNYKGKPLEFIEMKIKNNSSQPIVVLGNLVLAQLDGPSSNDGNVVSAVAPQSESTLEKNSRSTLSKRGKFAVAAVSVSTIGLGGPIFHEMLNPNENRKRNLGIALGRDGARHEIESERFTRRLVMPGDETSGWFGFDVPPQSKLTDIRVPVLFAPFDLPSGALVLSVKGLKVSTGAPQP